MNPLHSTDPTQHTYLNAGSQELPYKKEAPMVGEHMENTRLATFGLK